MRGAQHPAAAALAQRLRAQLRREVCFDATSRALYATDGSNYRQVPVGVVVPRDVDDVHATLAACHDHAVPVLPRGGGTSLAGQCCNAAVVMDFSKYLSRILDLDPQARRARVEPGVVLDRLREAAEAHHLTFAPDPSTHTHNTLGGMIGNNSCGVHSVMGGRTADNIESMAVLTCDGVRLEVGPTPPAQLERLIAAGGRTGQIYADLKALRDRYADLIRARFPDIPRRVSGFNLDELLPERGFNVARALVGSEGTCVTVLEATCRLVPSPPARALLLIGYADIVAATREVPRIMRCAPLGLEGMDRRLAADMAAAHVHAEDLALLPDGGAWLLVEAGGATAREAAEHARRLRECIGNATDCHLYTDPAQQARVWTIRKSGLGATAHVPGQALAWPGWEDSAVPPERLPEYLTRLRELMRRHGYRGDFYGHFGQGCLHVRMNFDLASARGIANYRTFVEHAADLCVSLGGSLSGEHGDGQARGELLERMYGPELVEAFREFKRIWDPAGRMNPGKVVDPFPLDAHLRLGADYAPPRPDTVFAYPRDEGSFGQATLRCVGVGECRKIGHGTMCPSYMATREERHSTRGRAHLLFEMLSGEVIRDGFASTGVREALDLCLSCKACRKECPVGVDMATWKAEFMHNHYRHHRRPREAYAFGLIDRWARVASPVAPLANALVRAPGTGALARWLTRTHGAREIPRLARPGFQRAAAHRRPRDGTRPRVVLWPDTFTRYFHRDVAEAAWTVLDAAGFAVEVPRGHVCCGRPLYEFGFLDRARRYLEHTLAVLREPLAAGVPVVGLEPACVTVFRDELGEIFPHRPDAQRLASLTRTFGEFLGREGCGFTLPHLPQRTLLFTHCNQAAVIGDGAERAVLKRLGADFEALDAGCCGMAGAFGFHRDKYAVSVAIARQRLLARLAREPDARVIADGFSCREQLRQTGRRTAVHLAQHLGDGLAADGRAGAAPSSRR
jgi:FAD/FMN-containing dehydrogenase/Fe-S oxidoreductase